jgi:hypothetical protein
MNTYILNCQGVYLVIKTDAESDIFKTQLQLVKKAEHYNDDMFIDILERMGYSVEVFTVDDDIIKF